MGRKSVIFILIALFLGISVHSQPANQKVAIQKIDSIVAVCDKVSTVDTCYQNTNSKSKEFWECSNLNNETQKLRIHIITDSVEITEGYYYRVGNLFYSSEVIITYFDKNKEEYSGWGSSYYLKNNILIYHETLGHGKSEMDDWNPQEEVIDRFKSRLDQLK